jgi:hypothetical protein
MLPTAIMERGRAFVDFGAQCSSQQNCEHLVGKISQVRKTGKSEKRANLLLIAGNDFFACYDPEDAAEVAEETENNASEENREQKKKKKCLRGRNKAIYIVKKLENKNEKNKAAARELGPQEYVKRHSTIKENLTSNDNSFRKKRRLEEYDLIMATRSVEPTINARMRQTGYEIPARLIDDIPISDVQKVANHEGNLDQEL